MNNIGILYVGIGEYIRFWNDFYTSCEDKFCASSKKHYFIVTDSKKSFPSNVSVVHQDDLGWPGNVTFRYLFFLRIKDELEKYDYVFFFNSNTRFRQPVTEEEFLPTDKEGGLIALTWKEGIEDTDKFGFERRPESAAYIPYGTKSLYLQSGITGGKPREYIKLLEECHQLTMTDVVNGITPVAHDESIYNKYMLNCKYKLLKSSYGLPSQWDNSDDAKIVFLKKEKVLGHTYLRVYKRRPHTNTILRKLMRKLGLVKKDSTNSLICDFHEAVDNT